MEPGRPQVTFGLAGDKAGRRMALCLSERRGQAAPGTASGSCWGTSPTEQVAQLAEQFQNWAADWPHDAGRPPEWPTCPQHPGAPHRLNPEVCDDGAVCA